MSGNDSIRPPPSGPAACRGAPLRGPAANVTAINDTATNVLLVEDDPADAGRIRQALSGAIDRVFRTRWVTRLADALERLRTENIEVILLDLTLPDRQGIDVFDQVNRAAPNAMILILCADDTDDAETARQAVRRGALDCLTKTDIDVHWLPRALRYIIARRKAEDESLLNEARFRAISNASPLGIFVVDALGRCVYANTAFQVISGQTLDQIVGTHWSEAIHPQDREHALAEWHIAEQRGSPFQLEVRAPKHGGEASWLRLNAAEMHDGRTARGHVLTFEDITERKSADSVLRAAEEALFEEKERAQVTLNSIGDAVLTTDLMGNVTFLNVVAESMTGWSCAEAVGQPLSKVFRIIDGTTLEIASDPAQRAIEKNMTVGLEANCVLIRRDGVEAKIEDSAAPIHNRDGTVAGAVIVFHDVSRSQATAEKMTHLAMHDVLTDLPNRALLMEHLAQAIGLARRHHTQVALLFIDLDKFKEINDRLGHVAGDRLLRAVAERLLTCVRATDTVCRLGGDEFVILLTETKDPRDAPQVADKLLAAVAAPFLLDGHQLRISASIGISIFPNDGNCVDSMLHSADVAMYHAKARGRNNCQLFGADINAPAVRQFR